MTKALTLTFFLALSGCAPQFKGEGLKIDPEFQPYVDHFIQVSKEVGRPVQITDLTVTFDSSLDAPGVSAVGMCRRDGVSNPRVTISPQFWTGFSGSPADREKLIFHELGHCVLNRNHLNDKIPAPDAPYALAVSVMHPTHQGSAEYTVNYNYYMKELFGLNPEIVLSYYGPSQIDLSFYEVLASIFKVESTAETTFSNGSFTCGEE